MKKNKALTAAISVLSLTMVSMCAIGGTFAKYASQGSATDTATVAKWGVTVTVTGDEAFAETYDSKVDSSVDSVVSTGKVLAPGTDGTLGTVSIKGKPEVMVNVSVSLDLTLSNWIIDTNGDEPDGEEEYCPLVFNVGGTEIKWGLAEAADDDTDGNDTIDTVAELVNAVEAAVAKTGNDIAANTLLDGNYDVDVKWSWPYVGNDTKDSLLGDAGTASITAAFSASVEQVD